MKTWAVTQWAINGAGGLSIDRGRIGVCGDSAGGNIPAVLALMARDAGFPWLQALIYPANAFFTRDRVHYRFANGYLLITFRLGITRVTCGARPTVTIGITGVGRGFYNVAPGFVLTCGYDPLFDEGRAYADPAGVLWHIAVLTAMHGFITMGKVIDEANEAVTDVANRVAAAFYDYIRYGRKEVRNREKP